MFDIPVDTLAPHGRATSVANCNGPVHTVRYCPVKESPLTVLLSGAACLLASPQVTHPVTVAERASLTSEFSSLLKPLRSQNASFRIILPTYNPGTSFPLCWPMSDIPVGTLAPHGRATSVANRNGTAHGNDIVRFGNHP